MGFIDFFKNIGTGIKNVGTKLFDLDNPFMKGLQNFTHKLIGDQSNNGGSPDFLGAIKNATVGGGLASASDYLAKDAIPTITDYLGDKAGKIPIVGGLIKNEVQKLGEKASEKAGNIPGELKQVVGNTIGDDNITKIKDIAKLAIE